MKRISSLLGVSVLAGAFTLGAYKLFLEPQPSTVISETDQQSANYIPTNYVPTINTTATMAASAAIDFSEAAEKTVNAVVHVKTLWN